MIAVVHRAVVVFGLTPLEMFQGGLIHTNTNHCVVAMLLPLGVFNLFALFGKNY